MHDIEQSLTFMKELGFAKSEFCIAGSAALYLRSQVALNRGYPPLTIREPNDVDVLCLDSIFERAGSYNHFQTTHECGIGDCLNIRAGTVHVELTREWPTTLKLIKTPADIDSISTSIFGFRVMDESLVASLKQKFSRPKDTADLSLIGKARAQACHLYNTF